MNKMIILLCLGVFNACGLKKLTPENSEGKTLKAKKLEFTGDMNDLPKVNLATSVVSAKIEANFLLLEVTYSGGCQDHTFRLVGSAFISKSLPPRRGIQIAHESAEPESCKAIVTRKLKINIKEFAHKQEVGSQIWLDIAGWKEGVLYTVVAEK